MASSQYGPTLTLSRLKIFLSRIEVRSMKTTIKRQCVYVLAVAFVLSLYGAGAYRIEQLRQTPRVAVCTFGHCMPTAASFSALR
jgi:fatty acid desaturase